MRTYETICLTKVDMPEDKYTALLDRCKNTVTQMGKGEWLYTDNWNKAKIAYPIGKDKRAQWTYFRFKSTAEGVDELRRSLKINEFVLREMTTHAKEDGSDYEPIRARMATDLVDLEKNMEWREERPRRSFDRDRGGDRGGFRRDRGGFGGRDEGQGFGGDAGGGDDMEGAE